MDLSVIIVNWNTRQLLADCLASLQAELYISPGLAAEVFVVDNNSSDGSPDMVAAQFPWVRLIRNTANAGFACANNQALRLATGRYLLLLNSDTKVCSGALAQLVDFMEANPRAGAAGARLLNADGSLQPSCHPTPTPWREFWRLLFLEKVWPRATYPMHRWNPAQPMLVDAIKGACLLLRRTAVEQVGVLDEAYFIYAEEVDLCRRLQLAGWQLWWVPAAHVIHYGEASSRQVAQEMYLQLYRSKIHFYRKFGGEREAATFKRLLRLAYWPRLIVAALGARFSNPLSTQASTYRRLLAELPHM